MIRTVSRLVPAFLFGAGVATLAAGQWVYWNGPNEQPNPAKTAHPQFEVGQVENRPIKNGDQKDSDQSQLRIQLTNQHDQPITLLGSPWLCQAVACSEALNLPQTVPPHETVWVEFHVDWTGDKTKPFELVIFTNISLTNHLVLDVWHDRAAVVTERKI